MEALSESDEVANSERFASIAFSLVLYVGEVNGDSFVSGSDMVTCKCAIQSLYIIVWVPRIYYIYIYTI